MSKQQKRKLTRRELWLLFAPIFVLGAVLMLLSSQRRLSGLRQDRFYVSNNLAEPVAKFRVRFVGYGNPGHELIFSNVPSNGEQWQLFGPEWGNGDSGRYITFEGVTASGKRIGSSEVEEFTVVGMFPTLDLGLGARFVVVVQSNGKLEIHENS